MNKKVKNILINILIISIAIIALVLISETISIAYEWTNTSFSGGSITVGQSSDGPNEYYIANNPNAQIYCIQHGADLNNTLNTYKARCTIILRGTEGEVERMGVIYSTSQSESNAIMSYILSGGTWDKSFGTWKDGEMATYTPRQLAIYYYWNTFVQNSGLSIISDGFIIESNFTNINDQAGMTDEAWEIYNAAVAYANGEVDDQGYGTASVEDVNGDITIQSDQIENGLIGPFKFKFTGTPTITAYDANGNELTIQLYSSNKTTTISQITSGVNFYIKATDGADIARVTVSVSAKQYRTRMWLLECQAVNNRWDDTFTPTTKQYLIAVATSDYEVTASAEVNVNIIPVGDLKIMKQDTDTSDYLSGMTFKVKVSNGSWLEQTSSGEYSYTASFENATTFTISDISGLTIESLRTEYTYQIWETKTPNDDYVLSDQTGYDSSLNAVNLTGDGQWISLTRDDVTTVTYRNEARYISISGYVWLDQVNKSDEYNSLWDDGSGEEDAAELRVEGVTVILKNKDGTTVATTTTDSNGEYIFDKESKYVRHNHTDEYYIEFDYSSLTITDSDGVSRSGTEYIPVAFNSATASEIVDNGSRALMDEVATYDEYLDGNATTYTGTNTTLEQTYGLSGNLFDKLYDESTLTLQYINLGLKPIYDPEYSIKENLAYVKIVYNGYTYTYEYGASPLSGDDDSSPTVKFQDSTNIYSYTKPFYPSAIYDAIENNADIEVYVVYGITIRNTTTYGQYDEYNERYKEIELNISSLTNTFDTTRYELNTTDVDDSNTTYEALASEDFGNWSTSTDNGDDTATTTYTGTIDGIGPGEDTTLFIQFSVKDEAIEEILENPDGIYEDYPTKATAEGYHTYTRLDYSWNNNISQEQTHYSTVKERESSAPYLVFQLEKDETRELSDRTVSGTVFEDGVVTTDDEVLGNGIFDDGEETVSGVTVELIDADSGDVATLYVADAYIDEDDNTVVNGFNEVEAKTTTDANGTFEFKGVVPGRYYIKLTYPNGLTYKSTIVTSEAAKYALGYYDGTDNEYNYGEEWYKYLEGTNYSVAVDDLGLRADVNEADVEVDMTAETPILEVTIENTIENYTDEVIEVTDDDGKTKVYGVQYEEFEGFNLGIIEQPTSTVKLEKIITNVSLVNTPTVILNGNPETDSMSGVSDLDGDSTNGGSTYTRIETAEENIYGSELTITYTISIENVSKVNYYETDESRVGWYYMFGEVVEGVSVEVQIDPEEIKDYLESTLTYVSSSDNITVTETTETDEDGTETDVLVITELGSIERTQTKSFEITAYKVLSTEDDDMGFTNEVEITSLINVITEEDSDNETLSLVRKPVIPSSQEAYLTISPPTGSDLMTPILYVVTTAVMLVVLAGVIIIIKKKVL